MDWFEMVKTLGLPTALCLISIGGCALLFKVFFAAFQKQIGDRITHLEDNSKKAVERIQTLENDKTAILERYNQQIMDLQKGHLAQITDLQAKHTAKLDGESKKNNETIARMQAEHTASLTSLIDRVTRALAEATTASQRMANALVQTLAALRSRRCMAEEKHYEPHHTPLPDVDQDQLTKKTESDIHRRSA